MHNTEAIILAGGLGTRLQSVVKDVPKPMATVSNKPFLHHLLTYLTNYKIKRIILSVGYKYEIIQQFFGAYFNQTTELVYVVEESPLGTGGALKKALEQIKSREAIVLNGDTFLRVNYTELLQHHHLHNAAMTMTLCRHPSPDRYGLCTVKNGVITGFRKSQGEEGYINAGVSVVSRQLFKDFDCAERFSFEQDFLEPNIHTVLPQAYICAAPFLDIGVPEAYAQAEKFIND